MGENFVDYLFVRRQGTFGGRGGLFFVEFLSDAIKEKVHSLDVVIHPVCDIMEKDDLCFPDRY